MRRGVGEVRQDGGEVGRRKRERERDGYGCGADRWVARWVAHVCITLPFRRSGRARPHPGRPSCLQPPPPHDHAPCAFSACPLQRYILPSAARGSPPPTCQPVAQRRRADPTPRSPFRPRPCPPPRPGYHFGGAGAAGGGGGGGGRRAERGSSAVIRRGRGSRVGENHAVVGGNHAVEGGNHATHLLQ